MQTNTGRHTGSTLFKPPANAQIYTVHTTNTGIFLL